MADERKARADALIALGNVLRASERYTAAVEAYDEAVGRIPKLEKRHWSLLYTRGIARERTQQWAHAEADFLRALEFEPDQPYVLNYLGYSWAEQGVKLEKAFEMIDKAVKQRPNDGYIVDSMGWVLYRMGKFEGAVTHLERAVEVRPEDPTINDHLGDAYWRVGRQTEARFQWRRALSLKPEPETIALIEAKLKHGLADAKVERKAAHEGAAGRGG
jgi:Flp pilus assembly protein TadD